MPLLFQLCPRFSSMLIAKNMASKSIVHTPIRLFKLSSRNLFDMPQGQFRKNVITKTFWTPKNLDSLGQAWSSLGSFWVHLEPYGTALNFIIVRRGVIFGISKADALSSPCHRVWLTLAESWKSDRQQTEVQLNGSPQHTVFVRGLSRQSMLQTFPTDTSAHLCTCCAAD